MNPQSGEVWHVDLGMIGELTRKAPGQFDASIISEVKAIIRKWLEL